MTPQKILLTALLTATLALSGCGLFGSKKEVDAKAASGQGGGSTHGADANGNVAPVEIGGSSGSSGSGDFTAGSGQNVVYFDFDNANINDAGMAIVAKAARYLAAHPAAKLRLEGHADERGTREYNVGLGERRANAVLQALVADGAVATQMSVISYGEERPVDPGHTEEAWAKNRRVEILK